MIPVQPNQLLEAIAPRELLCSLIVIAFLAFLVLALLIIRRIEGIRKELPLSPHKARIITRRLLFDRTQ